jgi:hypothetical protein
METTSVVQSLTDKPLFDPTFLNLEYVFGKVYGAIGPIWDFITNPKLWSTLGIISTVLSLIFIGLIVFSLVRMREIQLADKEEIRHEIEKARIRNKEKERNENPKWHYILTLAESPNESDWRVAIMEADSMLEDVLRDRGLSGTTLSELLEGAKESGYRSIQDAWDAHIIRNKIAHEGADFPLSQVEVRRVIKMFQNFFEELEVI